MIVKLLTEHHLEFLSLKGGCRGSSDATLLEITCHSSNSLCCISGAIASALQNRCPNLSKEFRQKGTTFIIYSQQSKEGKDQESIQSSITSTHTQESQEVSPFPAGDHKAARNRQDSITKTNMTHK